MAKFKMNDRVRVVSVDEYDEKSGVFIGMTGKVIEDNSVAPCVLLDGITSPVVLDKCQLELIDYKTSLSENIKKLNTNQARNTYTQYQNLLLATLQSNPMLSQSELISQTGYINDAVCYLVIEKLQWDKEKDYGYVSSSIEGSVDFDAMLEGRQLEFDTKIYNKGE